MKTMLLPLLVAVVALAANNPGPPRTANPLLASNSNPPHTINMGGTDPLDASTNCAGVTLEGKQPTAAPLEECMNQCLSSAVCGLLYFPPGDYLVEQTLKLVASSPNPPIVIRGDGKSTRLLWSADSDLLQWTGPCDLVTIASITVVSTGKKSPTSTAFRFMGPSVTRSLFDALFFEGADPAGIGSGLDLSPLTDSVTIRESQLWGISGTGIKIGKGSQVGDHRLSRVDGGGG